MQLATDGSIMPGEAVAPRFGLTVIVCHMLAAII